MLLQLNPGLMIWTIVTFLVLLLVLRLVAWKPILAMLEARENKIRGDIDTAAQNREQLLVRQSRAHHLPNAHRGIRVRHVRAEENPVATGPLDEVLHVAAQRRRGGGVEVDVGALSKG